ncbi:TIR domain-containing protein, partial [Shewanella sp.]|uniref:TIR domain-containing protein n=1 Tax=Shewanella sp. TaxID=50422 RepID=UPI003F3ACD45
NDKELQIGSDWRESINTALAETDFGLLLVSPAFLGSPFIVDNELPTYLEQGGKRCFPVMLAPVDFNRHDLKGLQDKQIFMLHSSDFKAPRAFNKLKPNRRADFSYALFAQIDDWLVANFKNDHAKLINEVAQ